MAVYKIPLTLAPQPEGGYVVTSPALPELVTEGDTIQAALHNAGEALEAIVDAFRHLGRPLPPTLAAAQDEAPIELETAVAVR